MLKTHISHNFRKITSLLARPGTVNQSCSIMNTVALTSPCRNLISSCGVEGNKNAFHFTLCCTFSSLGD